MSKEIKEILDKLKLLCYDDYCLEFSVDYIERKEEKILLDYITNLQQENEILRGNTDLVNLELIEYKNELEDRIDKAIKLINKRKEEQDNGIGWVEMRIKDYFEECDEVLNILQGSDKK